MPAQPLLRVLTQLRQEMLDPEALVRAVASGRRRGHTPAWRRVELRYVDLKAGRRLQVTAYDDRQAHTSNHEPGDEARDAVDALLDEPFGNWHVDTTTQSAPGPRDQEGRRAAAQRPRERGRGGPRTTTATRVGCCRRTTRCSWPSACPTTRAG